MLDDLIPLFGIAVPFAILALWIVLRSRRWQQFIELQHAERMAAIERGMEVPPLPFELHQGGSRRRRGALLPGLVWFFVGLAVLAGGQADEEGIPLLAGMVPLGIGVAYLIYYFVEGRRLEAKWLEHELARQPGEAPTPQS